MHDFSWCIFLSLLVSAKPSIVDYASWPVENPDQSLNGNFNGSLFYIIDVQSQTMQKYKLVHF